MSLEADAVKYIVFTNASTPHNVLALWQDAFGGTLPQGFQQPQQLGAPAFAHGTSGAFRAALVAQSGRLELALTANPVASGQPGTIKDIHDAIVHGSIIAKAIMHKVPVNRIALVVEATETVPDNAAAVARLLAELPFLKLPSDASDLLFQVNSKLSTQVAHNVEMNRICKWITGTKQTFQMQVGGTSTSQKPIVLYSTPIYGFTIELNTSGNVNDLTSTECDTITDKLVDEAKQLLTGGYAYLC